MKPFKTISQQLALLESRGMLIEDPVLAARALETIGYYRLSGYSYPFRKRLADVKAEIKILLRALDLPTYCHCMPLM